jgi:SET domain-containing protein
LGNLNVHDAGAVVSVYSTFSKFLLVLCSTQVFWTVEGKGWGIRPKEKLPQGAFVFEFIGEVLTNKELDTRNKSQRKRRKGPVADYAVVLDGDDRMEEVLNDDETLCLDAIKFGNISRFLNHRCGDANLIHHNVHIERLSTQLYHVFPNPNLRLYTSRSYGAVFSFMFGSIFR